MSLSVCNVARLREIKANIYSYNATLYRACANANPHNMNEAMIGISKEVSILRCTSGYQVENMVDRITTKKNCYGDTLCYRSSSSWY